MNTNSFIYIFKQRNGFVFLYTYKYFCHDSSNIFPVVSVTYAFKPRVW